MMASRPHILLADEDTQSQRTFREFFERKGWNVEIAPTLRDFEHALGRGSYDIIIADAHMPGLGPRELLGESFKKQQSQMLILVDETSKRKEELKFLRSGITDILTKPVDFDWLERCIEQAASYRRLDDMERNTFAFITSERTEIKFSSKQLGEMHGFSLPIINQLVASERLTPLDAIRVRLAVQEAVLNALEHGNLELESQWKEELLKDGRDRFSVVRAERLADPNYANKSVVVTSWFDGKSLEIVVKDEGQGFLNSRQAPTPQSENLSCSGRGMVLMSHAVDEVRFSHNGSEVTLIKVLNSKRR